MLDSFSQGTQNLPKSTGGGPDRGENRLLLRLLQQIPRGLVERHGAESVGLEKLDDVGSLDVFHQGVAFGVAGVGDDDVEVGDAMLLLKFLDGGEGVLFDGGVVFDEDEVGAFAFGEFGEGFGGGIGGVAVCGDDGLEGGV